MNVDFKGAEGAKPLGPLRVVLQQIETRLQRKQKRAEDAYVAAGQSKIPEHCQHRGVGLSGDVYVCRIRCMGAHEQEAAICYAAKARICPGFVSRRDDESLRREFRSFHEDELRRRWPSVGELMWIRSIVQAAILSEQEDP